MTTYTLTHQPQNEFTLVTKYRSSATIGTLLGWSRGGLNKLKALRPLFESLAPVSVTSTSLYHRLIWKRRKESRKIERLCKRHWLEVTFAEVQNKPATVSINNPSRLYQVESSAQDAAEYDWEKMFFENEKLNCSDFLTEQNAQNAA